MGKHRTKVLVGFVGSDPQVQYYVSAVPVGIECVESNIGVRRKALSKAIVTPGEERTSSAEDVKRLMRRQDRSVANRNIVSAIAFSLFLQSGACVVHIKAYACRYRA